MFVLIVAEKPSVAASIAQVVGAAARRKTYFEGNGYMVSWCLGHLVAAAPPDAYDARYSHWNVKDLPILPDPWRYDVIPQSKAQFNALTGLMLHTKVQSIICATDAGREGELIFRLVYRQCGCQKPVKRLWVSSMEEKALADGLTHLRDSSEYDDLYAAALCRMHADWIVGFNASRLYSVLYDANLSVGRVVSPTLALLVKREQEIAAFRKEPFYTVELNCGGFTAVSQRIPSAKTADDLQLRCDGGEAAVKAVESADKTEKPPRLYDLTTLQRDANRLYGYSAKSTLEAAQSLYEKKLLTYPRTDSRYLTDDLRDELPALVGGIASRLPFLKSLKSTEIPVSAGQVIDSQKVSDHHALIPTRTAVKADMSALPTLEMNVLTLVAVRLICAVGEPHRFMDTAVTLDCAGAPFTAKGRTEQAAGWQNCQRAFFKTVRDKPAGAKISTLPPLEQGARLPVKAAVKKGVTAPPKHYTEDTLLSAMENAGVAEFAEIPDAERKGLGTPATRADTIEGLLAVPKMAGSVALAVREGRNLLPTEKGMRLVGILPEALTSPVTTAEWETGLTKIARGEMDAGEWMDGIIAMIRRLIGSASAPADNPFRQSLARQPVGKCPWCGRPVLENGKGFCCSGHGDTPPCHFALWKDDRFFAAARKKLTRGTAEKLLKDGRVFLTDLYSSRKDRMYSATVVLASRTDKAGRQWPTFDLEFPERKQA